ncbi:hypothetical protein AMAG_05867 [Allomyces macrogynus ATCC 38327]|uniref:NodB homology domain-containing protein n=1 Tax=Allomyces macrogynus (strain ATCC 38327) TaxID=578462 RepID=A0A0L0SDI7_ALLM3|nr:hypothetical protein AMAG_05867 [Allomyces macrogynus ATCC 38327]|eukprot:KNE60484.1 hypothetical protein AMAG_05867 [Allomyces macrogynus ATCC 38327]
MTSAPPPRPRGLPARALLARVFIVAAASLFLVTGATAQTTTSSPAPSSTPVDCTQVCQVSSWKSELCYPSNDPNVCNYHKLLYCESTPNAAARGCTTGHVNVPCTISSNSPCSIQTTIQPMCGNGFCEVGELWNCPYDCAYASDGVRMAETQLRSTCPALSPLQRYYVLTFDDGPSKATPRLLDLLRARNATASFFVVGSNVDLYPSIALAQVRQGIFWRATRTRTSTCRAADAAILDDIATVDQSFYMALGFKPRFMRPPYGSVTTDILDTMRNYSQEAVMWNIDTFDYDYPNDPSSVLHWLQQNMQENPGRPHLIHLGHDLVAGTVEMVPTVMDFFATKGFQLTTLDNCLYGRTGVDVYGAVRSLEPAPVQKLVNPPGAADVSGAVLGSVPSWWALAGLGAAVVLGIVGW